MEENIIMVPGSGTKVIVRDVKQEIETAFLDYSMSVIVARALPDVRDGLKPVHRRLTSRFGKRLGRTWGSFLFSSKLGSQSMVSFSMSVSISQAILA